MLDEGLLDQIYAIVTDEDALAALLTSLADRFDCASAAVVYGDQRRPASAVTLAYGVFATALGRYEEYAALDPAPAAIARLPIGVAAATDRLFSEAERASSRFLVEFYNPLGLHEALGAPIARSPGQFGVLAVHRGPERPSFSDEEIETFGEIAGHVARAISLRSRFFALVRANRRQRSMLDDVATSLIVVDRSGQLLEANEAARGVLSRADGVTLHRSGRIRLLDREADADFTAALSRLPAAETEFVLARRSNGERPYILKISRGDGARDKRNRRAKAETLPDTPAFEPLDASRLIHIAEAFPPIGDVDHALVKALELSPPSARLISALLRGETVRDYAKAAGISENTAKFHLRSAFHVTGVKRQSELVQLCVSVLYGLNL